MSQQPSLLNLRPADTPLTAGLPGGWTALHKAARKGKTEMVEYLIESMADIESIDASMSTPLHCACWKGHAQVLQCCWTRAQARLNPEPGTRNPDPGSLNA
jgi:hypothetical protein